ncbi:alpha/beta hydrolase [Deinococcus yavapaiensis]|uniref:Alpha/beta hydrolase n=1 Tax=Deinococcus yavapaiensis KR-236 TaxID=694435 RepID=A0A318SKS6_9DEIO|nr:alpha/beta fold hydrolase [Deinococcus yavapaiensis]PYE53125.1 hypothetical protein DES52_110109 [Deinococcus yavapaiensis KR-236]
MADEGAVDIRLLDVDVAGREGAANVVRLRTSRGSVDTRLHRPASGLGGAGVLWVFGAGGGLGGPAGGLYARLADVLAPQGVTSLRVDYRLPNHLVECTLDVQVGAAYLEALGVTRLVLVGHSFGGAVVINAGANCDAVIGVVALSSQTYGADAVGKLSPRSLLLLHGEADEILSDACSRFLFERAGEPRELRLYPGCRHGLDECRDAVDRDLLAWLRRTLNVSPSR